jgi:hypothetical protein
MKRIISLGLILFFSWLGVICISNMAYTQDYRTFRSEREFILSNARWKFGPFFVFPGMQVNLGHDSNIYGTNPATGPVPDYLATISLPFSFHLIFRDLLIFSFSETPSYEYYFEQKNERSFNNSYSLDFRLLLFHSFPVSGGYQFSRAKYRATSEINRRVFQTAKGYYGRLFAETIRDTAFGFSGSIMKINYEDITLPDTELPLSVALNREERNGRLEFYYRVFSESHFFANIGYTEYSFDHPESSFRDSYSYQAYTGIRFPLFGRARGSISLGYKKLTPKQKSLRPFSGVVGNTEFSLRIGRFDYRMAYLQDVPFSYGSNNIYYIDKTYGAGLSFYLSQWIRLDYDFGYGGGDYPESQPVVLPDGSSVEIKRSDIYRSHLAGIVFRLIKNTGLGISVTYWERRSNYYRENVERTFIGAYITYEF